MKADVKTIIYNHKQFNHQGPYGGVTFEDLLNREYKENLKFPLEALFYPDEYPEYYI